MTEPFNQVNLIFTENVRFHTYLCLFMSLIFVFLGYHLFEQKSNIKNKKTTVWNQLTVLIVRRISRLILYITFLPALLVSIEKVIFVQFNSYLGYYTLFNTQIPYFILKLSMLFEFGIFLFFATMPEKKEVKLPILLYFIIGLLSLGYGQRNGFVLNTMFILIYLFLRNHINPGKTPWLTIKQLVLGIFIVPFIISSLYIFSYTRTSQKYITKDLWTNVFYFFNQQGGSVDIIAYGKVLQDKIPDHTLYSLGPIINMYQQNALFKILEIYPDLKPHTVDMALQGSSFGQTISYFISPSNFLNGVGYGSSYIAEVYHDFGYIGVAIINFIYGIIMTLIIKWCRINIWFTTFAFFMITSILYAPRAEALGFVISCFSITYIMSSVMLYIYSKNKSIKLRRQRSLLIRC